MQASKNMQEILGIIQLIIWIVAAAGFYYKMRNDINMASTTAKTDNKATCLSIKLTNKRIDKIAEDRERKWGNYNNDQKEQNNKLNEIAVGIESIKNDVSWLKNKK